MTSVIHADTEKITSFEAWCIPGEGAKYRYDATENRVTSDGWTETDGSGFVGGAYVFRYSGGEEVGLGKQQFPTVHRGSGGWPWRCRPVLQNSS